MSARSRQEEYLNLSGVFGSEPFGLSPFARAPAARNTSSPAESQNQGPADPLSDKRWHTGFSSLLGGHSRTRNGDTRAGTALQRDRTQLPVSILVISMPRKTDLQSACPKIAWQSWSAAL